MSQPPYSPQPGSYPPPQQPGGYQTPQQPQYGGGYGAPQSGQPYGAEAGQPGYGHPAEPPKKKSSVGKILLIVLAAVVLLCVGGGTAVYFATKDEVKGVVDATKTRVTAPATLAGKPKVTDPKLTAVAKEMEAEFRKDVPEATSTVGAFYGDPEKQDLTMIAGVSGLIADPKKELDDATKGLSTQMGVTTFRTIQPGPLGGDAKCGDGSLQSVKVAVCLWSDRGSLGMILTYNKPSSELEKQFVGMRGEIEKRD